jgi:hypothetical protein
VGLATKTIRASTATRLERNQPSVVVRLGSQGGYQCTLMEFSYTGCCFLEGVGRRRLRLPCRRAAVTVAALAAALCQYNGSVQHRFRVSVVQQLIFSLFPFTPSTYFSIARPIFSLPCTALQWPRKACPVL